MTKSRAIIAFLALALLGAAALIFFPLFGAQDAFFDQRKGGNASVGTEPPVPQFPEKPETAPSRGIDIVAATKPQQRPESIQPRSNPPTSEELPPETGGIVLEEPVIMLAPNEDFVEVPMFFATNRTIDPNASSDDFTEQFTNVDGDLLYGHATVTIPRDHRMGVLESQNFFSAIFFDPNPKKHLTIRDLYVEVTRILLDDVRAMLGETDNAILLYVHGYNTGMNKAVRRGGQLTYDLGWDGPSFVFSWPSQGSFKDYGTDSTLAERSFNEMEQLLSDLSGLNPDRLVVIAHSMGTKVFSHGLARLTRNNPRAAQGITSVILAAPDIDEKIFIEELAPAFRTLNDTHFTLYGSNKDSALTISEVANGFPRIGDTTNRIPVIAGFDVIDASTTTSNFFEHTYFAESTSILTDVYRMVQNGQSVDQRFGETLVKITQGDKEHWQINPEPIVLPACRNADFEDSRFRFHQAPCDPTLPFE